MRRYRLPLYFVFALSGLVYSGSNARAQVCAVQLSVPNHAWVTLYGHRLAQCVAGDAGCKCVTCPGIFTPVYTACFPLAAPIPY